MPRRSAALLCALPLALATTLAGAAPSQAGDSGAARTVATHYALTASGFGDRLNGGDLPVGSAPAAYEHIGCTNQAGLSHTNELAEQDIPDVGTLTGLATHVWTTRHHGVVASHARHSIAALTIADLGPVGSLAITGITSEV